MKVNTILAELSLPKEEKEISRITRVSLTVADTFLEPTRYLFEGKKVTPSYINDRTERVGAVAQGIVFKEKKTVQSKGIGGIVKKVALKTLSLIFFIPTGLIGMVVKATVLGCSSATRTRYKELDNTVFSEAVIERDLHQAGLLISGKTESDRAELKQLFLQKRQENELSLTMFLDQLCNRPWFGIESFNFVEKCLPDEFDKGIFEGLKEDALNVKLMEVVEQVKKYIINADKKHFKAHVKKISQEDLAIFLTSLYEQSWFTSECSLFVDRACRSIKGYQEAKERALNNLNTQKKMTKIFSEMKGVLVKNKDLDHAQKNLNDIPQEHLLSFLQGLSREYWMTWEIWEEVLFLLPPGQELPIEIQEPASLFRPFEDKIRLWVRGTPDDNITRENYAPKARAELTEFLANMPERKRNAFLRYIYQQKFLQDPQALAFFNSCLP